MIGLNIKFIVSILVCLELVQEALELLNCFILSCFDSQIFENWQSLISLTKECHSFLFLMFFSLMKQLHQQNVLYHFILMPLNVHTLS